MHSRSIRVSIGLGLGEMPGTQVVQQHGAVGVVRQPQPAMGQDEAAQGTAHGLGQGSIGRHFI